MTTRIAIDTRSLAVIRMVAGILIIADVLSRARHLTRMYTDEGVVPRSLAQAYAPEGAISIFWLTGDPLWVAILFAIHALVGIALVFGYHTRLMTVLAFVFVVSLDMRNVLVLSHADLVFRLLLFWAIFLPLGERWSVDARHRNRSPRRQVASLAGAMFLLQMVIMYALNGIWKIIGDGWTSGETAMLVFGIDEITFLLGDHLRAVPELLAVGGIAWFVLMVISPLLLIVRGRWRALLALAYAGGHLAFAVSVRIGAFPYVGLMGLVGFMQTPAWEVVERICERLDVLSHYHTVRQRGMALATAIPRMTIDDGRIHRVASIVRMSVLLIVVLSMVLLVVGLAPHVDTMTESGVDRDARFDAVLDESPLADAMYTGQNAIGIAQPSFTIFAPHGRTSDRYHVFAAKTTDGEWLDLYNDRPLSFDRPGGELQQQYPTYRDRFFMISLVNVDDHPGLGESVGASLCEEHDDIVSISMIRISETITRDTIDAPADRERWVNHFYTHGCDGHEPIPVEIPEL